jgi:hypothetical protein
VGYFTTNPTKLALHISEFSTIFYDFLRNLQETAKWLYYLSYTLQQGSGKNWGLTEKPLVCTQTLIKSCLFAIGSPGAGRRRSGQIPANRRPRPAGRGRRGTRGVSWLDSGRSSEWWWRRRRCTATVAGASRGAPMRRQGRGQDQGLCGSGSSSGAGRVGFEQLRDGKACERELDAAGPERRRQAAQVRLRGGWPTVRCAEHWAAAPL